MRKSVQLRQVNVEVDHWWPPPILLQYIAQGMRFRADKAMLLQLLNLGFGTTFT
jgi:hypothetical protein